MGLFGRLFGGRGATALVHKKGQVAIRNREIAASLPTPTGPGSEGPQPPCDTCGKAVEAVLITTGGPFGDPDVWLEVPIAVDGWACVACGVFRYPRVISAERITELMNEGVSLGKAGRWDEAEMYFVRVLWNWPGYPAAHLNYAEATRSHLHADKDASDAVKRRLEARMFQHYEAGVEAFAKHPSPAMTAPVARALSTMAEHAIRNRSPERGARYAQQLIDLPNADEADVKRGRELVEYVTLRLDLFHSAGEVLEPFLELMDRPRPAIQSGDERKRIADAISDLEEHLRHAPDRWQSAWLYAKALFAAERSADGFAAWERAWAKFPDEIAIGRDFSNCLLDADQVARAHAVNAQLLTHHPGDATLHCNHAVTHMLLGDIPAAQATLAESLRLDPNDPVARNVQRRLDRGAPFPTSLRELRRGG